MEIASNNILSITPPSFQLGAEEAKRESSTRVQIPQPRDSQGSQAQSHINDQRGNTQGQNSQLFAINQGFQEEKTEALRRDKRENNKNKDSDQEQKQENPKDNKSATSSNTKSNNKASSDLQLQQNVQQTQANAISHKKVVSPNDNIAASYKASSNRDLKGFLKPKFSAKFFNGAKFSTSNKDLSQEHSRTGNAIKRRYNSIMPSLNLGNNLNIAI